MARLDWEEVQGEDVHYINTQLIEHDCAHSNLEV